MEQRIHAVVRDEGVVELAWVQGRLNMAANSLGDCGPDHSRDLARALHALIHIIDTGLDGLQEHAK